jgi:hypothetical protein
MIDPQHIPLVDDDELPGRFITQARVDGFYVECLPMTRQIIQRDGKSFCAPM